MEAARHLIPAAAEFSASVEDGKDYLQGGPAGLGLNIYRDAPAVVSDGNGIARIDGHCDIRAVARQSLVNGVVHNLVDQVVQARLAGRADIHTGALADRLQTLQHLDLRATIFVVGLGGVQLIQFVSFFRHNLPPVSYGGRVKTGGARGALFPLLS